jgi:hypothetical protein
MKNPKKKETPKMRSSSMPNLAAFAKSIARDQWDITSLDDKPLRFFATEEAAFKSQRASKPYPSCTVRLPPHHQSRGSSRMCRGVCCSIPSCSCTTPRPPKRRTRCPTLQRRRQFYR